MLRADKIEIFLFLNNIGCFSADDNVSRKSNAGQRDKERE